MKRRQLILALGAGALAGPLASFSQQPPRVWRLGFLAPAMSGTKPGEPSPYGMAFVRAMQAEGHTYGVDYSIETRAADGDYERLPALAAELLKLNVDILIPISPPAVLAAHKASTTVPIVGIGMHDPVGTGMAASLARPGGNATGLATFYAELIPKHIELLRSMLPKVSRVAVFSNAGKATDSAIEAKVMEAGKKLGFKFQIVGGITRDEMSRAFAAMKRERAGAVVALADASVLRERRLFADLALKNRLPSFFATRESVQAGGLASYGENLVELFAQAAKYVSKIMKGAKPGDLPIEQPTKFSLVLNRTTAKALKLTIPQEFLLRVDEVID